MRFLHALKNDMKYQIKYGFYFLYTFISLLYIAILLICPADYKRAVASVIILTDPAMLGIFFIGGIWLLERDEGLHGFLDISPLRPIEYIMSKAVSLAVISTLAAVLIIAAGLKGSLNYLLIITGVFYGSMVFTIIGLVTASYAKSVNHYMLIVTPLAIFLTLPAILSVFGINYLLFYLSPGMALWEIIANGTGLYHTSVTLLFAVLIFWFIVAVCCAKNRIPAAMRIEGGKKV